MSACIPKPRNLAALAAVLTVLLAAGAADAGWKDLIKQAGDGIKKGQTGRKGRGQSGSSAAVRGAGEEGAAEDAEQPPEPAEPAEEETAPSAQGLKWLEGIRIDEKELGDFIEEGGLLP